MVLAVLDRRHGGFNHRGRGGAIGITHPQINQVETLLAGSGLELI